MILKPYGIVVYCTGCKVALCIPNHWLPYRCCECDSPVTVH